jgi:hypothetical protein
VGNLPNFGLERPTPRRVILKALPLAVSGSDLASDLSVRDFHFYSGNVDPDQIIAQFHYRQANKRSPNSIEALGDVPVDLQLLSRALQVYYHRMTDRTSMYAICPARIENGESRGEGRRERQM